MKRLEAQSCVLDVAEHAMSVRPRK
jgi:hypothetical protein